METFSLAAVSLSIALALLIKRRRTSLYVSFALLCFAVFVAKIGAFFDILFSVSLWRIVSLIGSLCIPPLLMLFGSYLLNRKTFLSIRAAIFSTIASLAIISFAIIMPPQQWERLHLIVYYYCGIFFLLGFSALIQYLLVQPRGIERERILYVAIASLTTIFLSVSDAFHYWGFRSPLLSDIAAAVLLYFVLMIITHPELPELYEIMLKGLFVFCLIVFATTVFYVILGIFGKPLSLPFTSILMASFIIVIFIDPVKALLEKLFSHFFFDKREFSVNLYPLDERVERETTVFLEEMATGFAHEIRNPLGSMKGAAQFLKTEVPADRHRKLLDVIIDETDRLNNAVSQFLNYARPHMMNLEYQSINHIVEKVITLVRTTDLPQNIFIEKELDPKLPKLKIDGEQLLQVILNVALNGIDAMPEGGALRFATERIPEGGDKSIKIVIADKGIGISREVLPHIFKPFYTTKKKGTGLGLSICRKIIRNHGGSMEVHSTEGEGTIITIRL
ncbi:MAG: hypothetical protein JW884_03535 [Deltaproteobacteria bacterium]|nr:hypothetical protein [Deltaproteobacteria bacterium]